MRRPNIEFLIGWLDAIRRGDRAGVTAALDDAIVWQGLRPEWACRGAKEVADRFLGERRASREIAALELIGAEGHAIMHASGDDVVAIEDVPLPDGIYNVFAIRDGRITRIEDFADRGAALAA